MPRGRLLATAALVLIAAPAAGQSLAGFDTYSFRRVQIGEHHWKLIGSVELKHGDTEVYCDEAELFMDEDRAVAVGNVVFTQGNNRIAADRAEFNIKTRL